MNPYGNRQEKDTVRLLNSIYQTSDMGATTLDAVIGQIGEGRIKRQLQREYRNYKRAKQESRQQLYACGTLPQEQNKLTKAMAKGEIHRKLLLDKSSSHISEMVVQGAAMGIIAVQKAKNRAVYASPESKRIADGLMQSEQAKIEQLKQFL